MSTTSPNSTTLRGGPADRPLRIGVIASLKRGLEHFIDREVGLLETHNCQIDLFPAKHRPGLYNPRKSWRVHRWSILAVLLTQPLRLLASPGAYLRTLAEAWKVGALGDFLLAAYFAPAMRELDILYATFGDRKLFVGYFAKRLIGVPLAVEIHAYELYDNPNPRLFPKALAACDQIITISQHNRELLCDQFGVHPERVEVVRLSLDLENYRPREKFIVLIVAYFVEKKGHEVLLKALHSLGRDDIELWVVGAMRDSSDAVDVPKLVEQCGLAKQVAFFGEQSGVALRALYQACDVFCLPCRHDSRGEAEGFPSVLIEAMASGKPVVTTRHVEIPRIVEQVLVPENDVAALAAALEAISHTSAAERQTQGEANLALAQQHFSPRNVARTAELLRAAANHQTSSVAETLPSAPTRETVPPGS